MQVKNKIPSPQPTKLPKVASMTLPVHVLTSGTQRFVDDFQNATLDIQGVLQVPDEAPSPQPTIPPKVPSMTPPVHALTSGTERSGDDLAHARCQESTLCKSADEQEKNETPVPVSSFSSLIPPVQARTTASGTGNMLSTVQPPGIAGSSMAHVPESGYGSLIPPVQAASTASGTGHAIPTVEVTAPANAVDPYELLDDEELLALFPADHEEEKRKAE